jgi:hypothetical protein
MKRMLFGIVVLGLLLASQLQATAAQPSKQVVFHVTGGFESGFGLTGTVTIETTHGTVLWANLAVVDAGNNIVAAFSGTPSTYTNSKGDVEIALVAGTSVNPTGGIVLIISSTSLKKYAGGSLVAYTSYWWWWAAIQFRQTDRLLGGSLEP